MAFDYQEYLASREWALLKNMVRQRSGGTCERCHRAPHQSTHHKTYARIGHELLEDLLGVCNPCHEWLSRKRDDDPALIAPITQLAAPRPAPIFNEQGKQARVYLAGKIGKQDWRHQLFPGLDRLVTSNDLDEWRTWKSSAFNHQAPIIDPEWVDLAEIERDGLLYGGPYFVGCDHGGYHGRNTHGQQQPDPHGGTCCVTPGIDREQITESCLSLIRRCDYVFCWLDKPDAYGSIFELGFAEALSKPVFLAMPHTGLGTNLDSDTWFVQLRAFRSGAFYAAGGFTTSSSVIDAWNQFINSARHGSSVAVGP